MASAVGGQGAAVDASAWSLGEHNAALLALRQTWFGPQLALNVACPHCREQLELDLNVADLPGGAVNHGELSAALDGWQVRFRVPRLAELERVPRGAQRASLIECCALEVQHEGEPRAASELPPAVVALVDEALAAADPCGLSSIEVGCSSCERAFQAPLDVGALLWHELDAWAHHTLAEVHTLASAYGWREAEVLSLSAQRRFLYLQLAAGR